MMNLTQSINEMQKLDKIKEQEKESFGGSKRAQLIRTIVNEKREEERRRIVQDHRIEAMKMGWRRPWDGENGEDFVRWVAARKGGEDDFFPFALFLGGIIRRVVKEN